MKATHPARDEVLIAIENEQHRIGNLLHENLCQTLAGVVIQLDVMSRRVADGERMKAADLDDLSTHICKAVSEARAVSLNLRASNLTGAGLMDRLDRLAEVTSKEVPCEYICEKPVFINDGHAAVALFRIAEEAVGSAVHHAAAKKIVLTLSRTSNTLCLDVRDDGKGFKPTKADGHAHGINLMRRRAEAVNAILEIQSKPGTGTLVRCTLPL